MTNIPPPVAATINVCPSRRWRDNLVPVDVEWLEACDRYLYGSTYGRGLWRRRVA